MNRDLRHPSKRTVRFQHETLERREMLAADISPVAPPATDPLDLNGDGFLSPLDALQVVNRLADDHSRNRLECDVNGDGQLSPADALMLVNELNRQAGESRNQPHAHHDHHGNGDKDRPQHQVTVRSVDGSDNNHRHPDWGSAESELRRDTSVDYGDELDDPAGADRASAREISNLVAAQDESVLNDRDLSDLLWQWGQFLDHDLDLTDVTDESLPIDVPSGDAYFDPLGTGLETIDFSRSVYEIDEAGVRQQVNLISSFIDGSNVYGSDEARADALRTLEGGRLKTSDGDLLPFNVDGYDNAGGTSDSLFLAGDVRANEQVGLTAMHTLWVREHNRIADELAANNPRATDEQLYQRSRAIVIAEMQAITFNEYLPALLGEDAIPEYDGYDARVNPSISNIFSTAAYRFGHSMLSTELLRLDGDGNEIAAGNLSLSNAFFNSSAIVDEGIDSILRGLASQQAQEIDTLIVDDVRNFLFGPPGAGGFDLAALNIQRGRDHGLPDYNQVRIDMGLTPVTSFAEITSDPEIQAALEAAYGSVDDIDVWVAGLADDHLPNSSMGELFTTVIVDQFARLRDGDSFWYERTFRGRELQQIDSTTLADVIERNTEITGLAENVFFVVPGNDGGQTPAGLDEQPTNIHQIPINHAPLDQPGLVTQIANTTDQHREHDHRARSHGGHPYAHIDAIFAAERPLA